MTENIIAIVLGFGGGAFCIIAAILNWDKFFENRRAYPFVKLFGRTGARIFYSILGLFLFYIALKLLKLF